MRRGKSLTLFLSTLPVPKTNRYIRRKNGQVFKPARVIHWEARALWEIGKQFKGKPFDKPLSVEVYFFFPDRRKRDIDNMLKTLWDILEKASVIENDNLIFETKTVKVLDCDETGTVVVIKPLTRKVERLKRLAKRLKSFKETL